MVSNAQKPSWVLLDLHLITISLVIHWSPSNELPVISPGLELISHNIQGDFYINAVSSQRKHINPMLSLFLLVPH